MRFRRSFLSSGFGRRDRGRARMSGLSVSKTVLNINQADCGLLGRFAEGSYFNGRVTIKVELTPGVLFTVMLPPCRSTIFLQIARPIPVPSYWLFLP